jgi:hypothetical protein
MLATNSGTSATPVQSYESTSKDSTVIFRERLVSTTANLNK